MNIQGNSKRYTHIYTGNGKGKTTAAMGLTLRALAAGWKVCFIQFLKGGNYSEHTILKKMDGLDWKKFGRDCLIRKKPTKQDRAEAQKGYEAVLQAMVSGRYDMVVADEMAVALLLDLIQEDAVLSCMRQKPEHVELVITGRGATRKMKNRADLVTEMVEKKHYYQKGVLARKGIER